MNFAADRISLRDFVLIVCGASALVALGAIAPAHAEDTGNCARYGADYVAVAGSGGCVRIGGHVRAKSATPALAYAPSHEGLFQTASNGPDLASFPPFRLLNEIMPK
jgi:hypothetical protein